MSRYLGLLLAVIVLVACSPEEAPDSQTTTVDNLTATSGVDDDPTVGGGGEDDPVQRLAGADRFATAGALAPHVDGDTLWVATGFDFADALAAGATSAGPVLLVAGDTAPQSTLDAVADLEGIERVRTVGGSAAVGDDAVQAVADAADVDDIDRLSGAHRFATAAQVSQDAHPDGATVAYVATGLAFPDALTASAAAADDAAPVLLAAGDTLPDATRDELDRLDLDQIVVVGGEAAITAAVEADLGDYADEVTRVAGADRFATAAAVSAYRGVVADEAFVATGEDFPDVLAAAPAAISAEAGLLLSGRDVLPGDTRGELERLDVQRVTIAGGEAAVSPAVADEIRRLLGFDPSPGEITVEFFDVGQADAALVSTEEATILVDAGHWQRDDVVSHLTDAGVTDELDVLVATHHHADHLGQVPEVLDVIDVSEVWHQPGEADTATYDDAITAIEASDAVVRQPRQGETHTIGDVTVDIIGPDEAADPGDHHDATLALRVEFADARVLFTGDAESPTEARYVDSVAQLLDAQLYQVGHHGSRTSTSQALLDAVTPEVAVYSAGADNQFGHPHSETLSRLDAAGVEVFGTDVNGTVTATSDGSTEWTITPERGGSPTPGGDGGDDEEETTGCVDVNRENDLGELQRIIHIGEQRAHDLIEHRPYDTLDQLQRIDGIGPSRVQDIKDQGLAAVEC